jgi:adenosylcobinamide-GDP ribazoletransferase
MDGGAAMRVIVANMISWLHGLIAAFQFLTRLPIPIQISYTNHVFVKSVVFYPAAGMVIGLLLGAAGLLLDSFLPLLPAAVLLLSLWIVLTGGLHLDGLMDTADGILSHRPREQMLEIMKDSRVGAMGVIVCVLHLLLKFSLLYTLLEQGNWKLLFPLLILIPIWSRWFMAVAIWGWPYARQDSGLGSFFRDVHRGHVWLSTGLSVLLSVLVMYVWCENFPTGSGFWSEISMIIAGCVVVALAVGVTISVYLKRKLGGLTGDTYGALNEIIEAAMLLALTLYI